MKAKWSLVYLVLLTVFTACQSNVRFALPEAQQAFGSIVTYNNKVDIVWIVDNSSSMLQHQEALSVQIPEVVAKMNSLKMDYRMVVITTDMRSGGSGGLFVGTPTVLTQNTPDLTNALKGRIIQGQTGSSLERGMESLERVLSPSYLNNEGQGFLRSEALLVINVLSNEDDNSAGTSSYYANFLNNLKGAERISVGGWILNFIGVLANTATCRTFNDFAEPGLKFMELADLSGGIKDSICTTNLSQAISNISIRIVSILTDYKLDKKPNLASVVVKINGKLIPQDDINGWSYIESLNVIRFNGSSAPSADAAISIDYTPAGAN